MIENENVEYDLYPCDDCPEYDHCDGWEMRFCCTLCRWQGGGWDCENCNPMDI